VTESIVTEKPGATTNYLPQASTGAPRPLNQRGIHAAYLVACALADAEGVLSAAPPLGSRPVGEQQRYLRAAKAALAGLWGYTWARACHSLMTIVRADVADLELGETCAQVRSDQLADVAADAADTVLGLYDDHLAAAYDQAVR
jgi:hypothetical protein